MRKIALIGLLTFCSIFLKAQVMNPGVLYQVGIGDSLYSDILREQRTIFVQVPASYGHNPNRKYPVVYVLDGEVLLPTIKLVQDFYSGGFMPEMVIVGISNRENRIRDLTTSVVTMLFGRPFNEATGGAEKFQAFMAEELIPYIEKQYPVTKYRTLIGHSHGGLFTIHTLLKQATLFENYLAIDPSLYWDGQHLLEVAKAQFANGAFQGKAIYMSLSGQLHGQNPDITIDNVMEDQSDFTVFARSNLEFRNLTRQNEQNGLSLTWEFFPKELHGTIPFPSIKNGLIALFDWFQMEQTDKFNSPETSHQELDGIITYRADKLQDHFGYKVAPYPEDLLNTLGYMSMDMDQWVKSKMFLEYTIEYYPESANAYDSMADFYERQEDYPTALKWVTQAYDISGSDYHQERIRKLTELVEKD